MHFTMSRTWCNRKTAIFQAMLLLWYCQNYVSMCFQQWPVSEIYLILSYLILLLDSQARVKNFNLIANIFCTVAFWITLRSQIYLHVSSNMEGILHSHIAVDLKVHLSGQFFHVILFWLLEDREKQTRLPFSATKYIFLPNTKSWTNITVRDGDNSFKAAPHLFR